MAGLFGRLSGSGKTPSGKTPSGKLKDCNTNMSWQNVIWLKSIIMKYYNEVSVHVCLFVSGSMMCNYTNGGINNNKKRRTKRLLK